MKRVKGLRRADKMFYLGQVSERRLAAALIVALIILTGMGIHFYHLLALAIH